MDSKKVQKSWLRTGAAFVVLVVLSMAVVADASYTGPSWRNGAGTTFEQWTFPNSSPSPDSGTSPDTGWHNTFGTPELWVEDSSTGGRSTYYASIDSHTGIWTPGSDEIDLQIPNSSATGAGTEKHIWAEITWKVDGAITRVPDSLMVGIDPAYPTGSYTEMDFTRSDTPLGSGWYSTVVMVDIWPNPISEWITVKGDIYIDEITIDTQCIPEPATFGLLIGGAFMALRKRILKSSTFTTG